MSQHTHRTADLTRNQSLVMGTLASSNGPMSAYTILDELRGEGLRAPLQVYRALEKLVEFGLVHRLGVEVDKARHRARIEPARMGVIGVAQNGG